MKVLSIIWIVIAVIGIVFGLYCIVVLPLYYLIKRWFER